MRRRGGWRKPIEREEQNKKKTEIFFFSPVLQFAAPFTEKRLKSDSVESAKKLTKSQLRYTGKCRIPATHFSPKLARPSSGIWPEFRSSSPSSALFLSRVYKVMTDESRSQLKDEIEETRRVSFLLKMEDNALEKTIQTGHQIRPQSNMGQSWNRACLGIGQIQYVSK